MPTIACTNCTGMFARDFFSNPTLSKICRMCKIRTQLEEKVAQQGNTISEKVNTIKEHDDLIKNLICRMDTLQEFVSNNIGQGSENSTRLESGSDAVPRTLPSVINNSSSSTPTPTQITRNDFQPVRNGATRKTRTVLPITTYNSFQVLATEEEDSHEVRMVGDSIIRGQLSEFCGRAPRSRKRFCIPGGDVDDVCDALDYVTNDMSNESLLLVHVGSNNIPRTRSEELLEKYKKMIDKIKCKTNNILISGVLPRIGAANVFFSRAFSLNNRLESLCRQEGVQFINTWNHFYEQPLMFSGDGLHLNAVGSARFGRLMSEAVHTFWRKNGQRTDGAQAQT